MNEKETTYVITVRKIKKERSLNLSEKENQILSSIMQDKSHKEIAYEMNCSRQNIEQSIRNACIKNQVENELQLLIKYGIANAIKIDEYAI